MKLKYILTGALVLIIIVFALRLFLPNSPFRINRDQAAVVKEMRKLNRLETASFTIEKIIEAGTQGNAFNQFLFGDQILLIAHGEVIAGFDLSQMEEDQIEITGSELKIQLPPPQILVIRLDNDMTRVYDRQQGLLTKGNDELESEARVAAELEIKNAACQANILQEASTNARNQLTALFKAVGFETVIIDIPNASC